MKPITYGDPYSDQAGEIERRRRLAEMLQQESSAPMDTNRMAGGWVVPISPFEGLAKAAKGIAGGYHENRARELAKELREKQQQDRSADMTSLAAMLRGRDSVPASSENIVDEQANGGMGAPATIEAPAVPARPGGQIDPAMVGNMRTPDMQNMAMQMWAEQMKKENAPPKYHVVGGSLVPEPRPGQYGPIAPAFTAPKYHTVGGNLVPEPSLGAPGGTPVKPIYSAPEKDEAAKFKAILEGAGIDPESQQGKKLFMSLATKTATHQPPTQVSVSTERGYGQHFAGKVADQDVGLLDAARKAPELATRSNSIKETLASGKVITGAGADYRLALGKALNLVGASDAETIANTETLSTSLARNTLDAIKASGLGSGSGFSNADRDFLEKAAGGKINLEAATIGRLADLSHRAAEQSALSWNKRVKDIPESALGGTGIKRDPIVVPPLFGSKRKQPINDETQRLLDMYDPQGGRGR